MRFVNRYLAKPRRDWEKAAGFPRPARSLPLGPCFALRDFSKFPFQERCGKKMKMNLTSWFSGLLATPMTLDNLRNLLIMQLRDLASAEDQLIDSLPKMAEGASSAALKKAFTSHHSQTTHQRNRLDKVFRVLQVDAGSEKCEAMQGLITEGNEILRLAGDPSVKDAALIAAAQRIEHYEIAGYGCARTFASQIGEYEVAKLLGETLAEEKSADDRLTEIAEASVNRQAAAH